MLGYAMTLGVRGQRVSPNTAKDNAVLIKDLKDLDAILDRICECSEKKSVDSVVSGCSSQWMVPLVLD